MKYISEDSRKSKEADLARAVYGEDNVIFSGSNGNLESDINGLLLSGYSGSIVVYVDLVPGNVDTINIFSDLLEKYQYNKELYIVPLLSSESCVIKSLVSLGYNVPEEQLEIIEGLLSYKTTKYSNASTLEKATKLFYNDIPLLANKKYKYFKDSVVLVGAVETTLEERGVHFIFAQGAYLKNSITVKYAIPKIISLADYLKIYIDLYNRVARVNGFRELSDSNIKSLLGYCKNK